MSPVSLRNQEAQTDSKFKRSNIQTSLHQLVAIIECQSVSKDGADEYIGGQECWRCS